MSFKPLAFDLVNGFFLYILRIKRLHINYDSDNIKAIYL